MWTTGTTTKLIHGYPQSFPKAFSLDFQAIKRVFHKPTAPTTTATSQILYILLIHVNKGVVHSYEINSQ